MLRFLGRRLFAGVLTVLIASFVLFAAISLLPGDEVRGSFGFGSPPPGAVEELVERLHLDRPFLVQYGLFLRDFLTLDLGTTMGGAPIAQLVRQSLPVSAVILVGVATLQVLLAPLLVWLAGMRPETPLDRVADSLTVVLVSIPALVAAFLVQAVFVYWTDLIQSPVWIHDPAYPGWRNYVMPILALGVGAAAHLAMVGRVELLAALSQPWAKAAAALGMPREHLVRVDALRPAAGAMVQLLGANMAVLVTGLIVVEDVFDAPGLGSALLRAINDQDRLVIVTLVMFVLVGVIVVNTLSDLVHGWLDPRIREELT